MASDPLLGATPERELSRSGSTRPHVLPRVEKRPNVGPFGAWYVFPMVLGRELELRAYGSHLVCEDKDDSVAWESLPEAERERVRKPAIASLEAAQLQDVRRKVQDNRFRSGMRLLTGSALRARQHPQERCRFSPARTQERCREPRRRSVSRGPRRARAPGRSGDDESEPERNLERRDAEVVL